MKGYIYKIINVINNKIYIGQTIQKPSTRFRSHVNPSTPSKMNYPLTAAIRKYGENNFKLEILHEIICQAKEQVINQLNLLEIEAIKQHNSIVPNGYNLSGGGKNSVVHEQTKQKQSAIKKKRMNSDPKYKADIFSRLNKAIKNSQTPEAREKARLSQLKTNQTPETKLKRSNASKHNWTKPAYQDIQLKSLKESWSNPERRNRMSSWVKSQWKDPEYRRHGVAMNRRNTQNPKNRLRASNQFKELWQTDDFKEKQRVAREKNMATPGYLEMKQEVCKRGLHSTESREKVRLIQQTDEYKKKQRDTKLKKLEEPDYKKRVLDNFNNISHLGHQPEAREKARLSQLETNQTPETKHKRSVANKKIANDPVVREKRLKTHAETILKRNLPYFESLKEEIEMNEQYTPENLATYMGFNISDFKFPSYFINRWIKPFCEHFNLRTIEKRKGRGNRLEYLLFKER